MKKMLMGLLSVMMACCCAFAAASCGKKDKGQFAAPAGFAFDENTFVLSFDKTDGAESYNAKVLSNKGAVVYENAALKEEKIALADKNLSAGEYTANVSVNATEEKSASETAEYKFTVTYKIATPMLTAKASQNGTLISWTVDEKATSGYKAVLKQNGTEIKTYDVAVGTGELEIVRADAAKGKEFTVEVYGVATAAAKQSETAKITFTQSFPALDAPENITVNGLVASWDKISEASAGYTVNVYRKGDEGNVKLENRLVAQSDNPSIDLSELAYAAEKEYIVGVVANAVENEYAASEIATAEYTSGAVWTFADEEDKELFISHGPTVELAGGKLVMSEPKSGANVVRFKHHFNVGDKITITLKTQRVWIYGNSRTDNAAHVVKAFICDGKLPDQVGWNEENEKQGTLVLTVTKEIEGLFMDMDAAKNLSVTIERLEIEEKTELFGSYLIYSGKGATAKTAENGTLKMKCTDTSDKCATIVTTQIKANSIIEVTYGNVTLQDGGDGKFFIYGINGGYDTLIIKDTTVLRRNGYTNDINTETVGGNKTVSYMTDYDISGLRFDFASVGTTVEVKRIRIIEPKTSFNFASDDDSLWFTADDRVNDGKQMTLNVVENDGAKALNVKSVNGSNMLIFSQKLKAGSKITIDLKSKACFVYGKPESTGKNFDLAMDAVGETEISNAEGTRHTVTLDVNADCVGIYIMFNAAAQNDPDGSFIYSITITPPQA